MWIIFYLIRISCFNVFFGSNSRFWSINCLFSFLVNDIRCYWFRWVKYRVKKGRNFLFFYGFFVKVRVSYWVVFSRSSFRFCWVYWNYFWGNFIYLIRVSIYSNLSSDCFFIYYIFNVWIIVNLFIFYYMRNI